MDRSRQPLEARLSSGFGGTVLITRKVAAALIGVDVRTLTRMREQSKIAAIRTATGEYRFSEKDIRAYLNHQGSSVGVDTSDPVTQVWNPRMPNRIF